MKNGKITLKDYLNLNNILSKVRAKGLSFKEVRTFIKNKKELLASIQLDIDTIEELKKSFFDSFKGRLSNIHGKELKDMSDSAKKTHYEWIEAQRQLQLDIDFALNTDKVVEFPEKVSFTTFCKCSIDEKEGTLLDNLSADELSLLLDLFCEDV